MDTNEDSETETESDLETVPFEDTGTALGCGVPSEFSWTSSDPLISPPANGVSIKDPTVVLYNDDWLVYATTVSDDGLSMSFLSFSDWDQAGAASQTPVSANENLAGYKAAPQLFYFARRDLWYLVYQTQEPAYSTTKDPADVLSWSSPTQFMPMPSLLTKNGDAGIDYWVICDDADCYMFFSANNGVLYRANTSKEAFPDGFEGTTKAIMQDDDPLMLHNACNVYKLAGTDQYLLLVSALIGGKRFFRSWTADRLNGDWTRLADTESNAFASLGNVTGADWAIMGIEQGEVLRTNPDETMTIDTCNMQYLFSALTTSEEDPESEYWYLGLLTFEK